EREEREAMLERLVAIRLRAKDRDELHSVERRVHEEPRPERARRQPEQHEHAAADRERQELLPLEVREREHGRGDDRDDGERVRLAERLDERAPEEELLDGGPDERERDEQRRLPGRRRLEHDRLERALVTV